MHLILQNFNTCNASTHNVGCPKVKWLHLRGEVDKSLRFSCQISAGFNVPKVIKIFSFSTELFKKQKMGVFWDTVQLRTAVTICYLPGPILRNFSGCTISKVHQSINQREICRAPLYETSRSANSSQWYARSKSTLLSRFLNVLVSVMWWRSEGRVFQAAGPQKEKPRSPNLVLVLGRT